MHSLLWELYELNFCFELYVLNCVLATSLWTSSDEAQLTRCESNIFPRESGLVMWSEPLLQDSSQMGMCSSNMQVMLPYLNSFHELLSTWPGAPSHLQSPAELDGEGNARVYEVFICAAEFYMQTVFDFLG
ncbi:hypothetical protein M404DRAFT_162371 [Pisolithus tinctorius Marx 270]|uniref:Uncharacterized protein n=1 Tax=Pisolithus tinctorius Marx 270 TaxID=870435 RepID=A0A0C3NM64_PISTI|nr:hypothetical protein M404DRAFT_162371 [Pisolithus tinctorius Marx 270]